MPLLSRRISATCDELELACLLSLSMLFISTSFRACPNAMMAQLLFSIKHGLDLCSSKQKRNKIK